MRKLAPRMRKVRTLHRKTKSSTSGIPTWLVGLLSGGAGLATGTTIGTVFGNDIKAALSKVPVIGNLFKAPDPVVQNALNGQPSPTVDSGGGGSHKFNTNLWEEAMTPGTPLNSLIESQNAAVLTSADYANTLANLNGGGF